jgi:signal transduction histidine kinase/predicted ATPase/CheY-like chemotaxis protein
MVNHSFFNYTVLQRLSLDCPFEYFLAQKSGPEDLYYIKSLSHPTVENIQLLKNDFKIASLIPNSLKIEYVEIHEEDEKVWIVTKAAPIEPLLNFAKEPLEITEFLEIAISLCVTLKEIHQLNITHRSISPTSVFWNNQKKECRLARFSHSTHSQSHSIKHEKIDETLIDISLPFISPEQTGRAKISIDQRSDIYSLGTLFYWLLTQKTPFEYVDFLSYNHALLTQKAPLLESILPQVPPVISKIIQKLLNKNPDERYQGISALLNDLNRCQLNLQSIGKIDSFQIAQNDVPQIFRLSERLYRREEVISTIEMLLALSQKGANQFCTIYGDHGSGKTTIASQIRQKSYQYGVTVLYVNFAPTHEKMPYTALIEGINAFLELKKQESQSKLFFERIQNVLHKKMHEIQGIFPILEEQNKGNSITSQTAIMEFDEVKIKHILCDLFETLSNSQEPILLYCDQMEYADQKTLEIFEHILLNQPITHILTLATYYTHYAPEESIETHPLTQFIQRIENKKGLFQKIELTHLTSNDLSRWLIDSLQMNAVAAFELGLICHEKTDGNPFFVKQFLTQIAAENLLKFESLSHVWVCDLEKIACKEPTQNVIKIIIQRLKKLPQECIQVLHWAACIGTRFSFELLERCLPKSALLNILEPALQAHLIYFLKNESGDCYEFGEFLSPAMRDACFEMSSEISAEEIHLGIARCLVKISKYSQLPQEIEQISNHYFQAHSQIKDLHEIFEVVKIHILAGENSLKECNYTQSFEFMQRAQSLVEGFVWNHEFELGIQLYTHLVKVARICGSINEMETYANFIIAQTTELEQRLPVYEELIQYYTSHANIPRAIDLAQSIFNELGLKIPKNPSLAQVMQLFINVRMSLGLKPLKKIRSLKPLKDESYLVIQRIATKVASAAYISNPQYFAFLVMTMVKISIKQGIGPWSYWFFSLFGILLCALLKQIKLGVQIGELALELSDSEEFKSSRPRILFNVNTQIRPFAISLEKTMPHLLEGQSKGIAVGDYEYATFCAASHSYHLYYLGRDLVETTHFMDQTLTQMVESQQNISNSFVRVFRQAIFHLVTEKQPESYFSGPFYFHEKEYNDPENSENNHQHALSLALKIQFSILFNTTSSALPIILQMDKHIDSTLGFIIFPEYHFASALAILNEWTLQDQQPNPFIQNRYKKHRKSLNPYTQHGDANYKEHAELLDIVFESLSNSPQKSLGRFALLLEKLHKKNQNLLLCLAHQQYAQFWTRRGSLDGASMAWRVAHLAAIKWGAVGLARFWNETHLQNSGAIPTFDIDRQSILQASQLLAQELDLDKLAQSVLNIVLMNSGANRGCFLVQDQNNWLVLAQKDMRHEIQLLEAVSLESYKEIAKTVVRSTIRSQESVILDRPGHYGEFSTDTYLSQAKPESLMILPIKNKNQILGLLYLENDFLRYAFDEKRQELLRDLSHSIAISLEKAHIFSHLEASLKESEELRKSTETAMKLKERFLANMSHEIRTPMNGILGMADLLMSGNLAEEERENVSILRSSAESMLHLLNQILNLSKIESGQIEIEWIPMNLHALVSEIVQLTSQSKKAQEVPLLLSFQEDLHPFVIGDPTRIRQILNNLLSNALKFSAQGNVYIHISRCSSSPDCIRISVRDEGIGIAADRLEAVFDAFVQADISTTRHFDGTGLGLSISRQLARAMGGDLTIESTLYVGTTLELELPLKPCNNLDSFAPNTKNHEIEHDQNPDLNPTNLSILVIEDNLINLKVVTKMLDKLTIPYTTAKNGQEGLAAFKNQYHPIILMDCMMPIMDGYEATQAIRQLETKQPWIIALTANAMEGDREKCLNAGMNDFMSKPIKIADLKVKFEFKLALRFLFRMVHHHKVNLVLCHER